MIIVDGNDQDSPVFVLINETTISLILVKIMCITVLVHLVVVDHVVEGLIQLIGTLFDLELLPVDLVLDVVDPLVKLGNVHLSILKPRVMIVKSRMLLPKHGSTMARYQQISRLEVPNFGEFDID